ncbi:MAG TPA: ATP-binding cassette domain-containing protein [Burkholderiaceae bacterium]|nr:ATP-binding cassette domain-containing protein [Burkholderiaceae bacterium]
MAESAARRLLLRGLGLRLGGVEVLRDVSLELPVAGRTVIVGPNGAGKSTLLQAIHGMLPPESGRVDAEGPRPRLALVFQRPAMLRRSALANVEHALAIAGVPAGARVARARAALEDVGLGYAADRPARRLSGGEQQRLAIARAQSLEPECLLLDEPTASLDPAAGAAVERHLLALAARGIGLVMTTHDLAQARRVAQRIVLMHRGRVVEDGPADAFFASPRTDVARRFLAGDWLE